MYGKGLALAGLGKYDEAIEYYDKIIETSEKYLLEYTIYCNIYRLVQNYLSCILRKM